MDNVGQETLRRGGLEDGEHRGCGQIGLQAGCNGGEGDEDGGIGGECDTGQRRECEELGDILLLAGEDMSFGEDAAFFDCLNGCGECG